MQDLNYEEALALMEAHIQSESLRKHCKNVELAMRHYAKKWNEDENYWAIVGLLHDLDYEKYPDQHCTKTPEMLREKGYSEEFIHSVLAHGYGLCTDVKPEHTMEKVLYTVDELTGFVTACALMRPTKSVEGMEFKSVNKKFKTANFAAAIKREVILNGCEMLGLPFEEVVMDVVASLQNATL